LGNIWKYFCSSVAPAQKSVPFVKAPRLGGDISKTDFALNHFASNARFSTSANIDHTLVVGYSVCKVWFDQIFHFFKERKGLFPVFFDGLALIAIFMLEYGEPGSKIS
jgi:hypothetical protein